MRTKHPLVHFPIAFFAMVMGLAASFMMAQHTELAAFRSVGAGPLDSVVVVVVLLSGTVLLAYKGAIYVPD